MKLHVPDDLHTMAERLRAGAETVPAVLRLALERGLAALEAERRSKLSDWRVTDNDLHVWDHHSLGDGVVVSLRRQIGCFSSVAPSGAMVLTDGWLDPQQWELRVCAGEQVLHSELIPGLPGPGFSHPPYARALGVVQVFVEATLLRAIGVPPK